MPEASTQSSVERCLICDAELPLQAAIRGADRLLGTPGRFEVRVCRSCGAGSTSPRVAEAGLGALYPPGYGSHEQGAGGPVGALLDRLKRVQVALILRSAPLAAAAGERTGTALDVGCGRGDLARGLLDRGWRVDGVEPSERAAAIAAGHGVRVLAPTLSALPPADGVYDLIVLRHSLEHLADPIAGLRAITALLAPGGRVAISLPNFGSWQRRSFGSRWFHLDVPRHRVHVTAGALALALRRSGLRVTAKSSSTSLLGLPASIQYAMLGRCIAPGGWRLRLCAAACVLVYPLARALDALGGEGDTLHAIAERS